MKTRKFRCVKFPLALAFVSMASILFSCQTPKKKETEPRILPAHEEFVLATELNRSMERELVQWTDPEVNRFLMDIANKLVEADLEYKKELSSLRIRLLGTNKPYIAAGLSDTIYVSRGILSTIKYENELAFLIGTQLALLKDDVPIRHFTKLHSQELGESLITLPTTPVNTRDNLKFGWFEQGGLFDFGLDHYLKADTEALKLIHKAYFDPRGATTLIQRWAEPAYAKQLLTLAKIWPAPEERLMWVRSEIAKLLPLRDPIVKTPSFERFQKRLDSLKIIKAKSRDGKAAQRDTTIEKKDR